MPEFVLPPEEACDQLRKFSALNRVSRPVDSVALTLLLGELREDGYSVGALAYVCNLSIGSVYGRVRKYKRYRNGENFLGFPSHLTGSCRCHA